MDEFVANFNLDRQEFEADFELEQPVEFDAVFEINPTGASWGGITGTLSNQTDLQNALNLKADKTELDADVELLNQTITETYNTLDNKIDDVNSDLSGDISTLTQTVENNNTAINNRVDGIVDSFDADIEEINTDISNLETTVSNNYTDLNTKIQNEATTRAENDSLLRGDINTLNTNLTSEISNRETADSNLQTQINSVKQTADSAIQPNDNITLLNNNAGYITNVDLPTLEDLTTQAQLDAINSGATSAKIGQIATNTSNINSLSDTVANNYNTLDGRITSEVSALNTAIGSETTNRQNADNALQSQIDAIVSSSDVFDIIGTYAELQAYDISTVPVNDIIKVLVDSTHNNSATYYRCTETGGIKSWTYIGAEGAYYTKSEADNKFVEQTTTINNKPLSSNVTLTASDVGALPSSTVIGSGVLTIQKNGSNVDTFSANAISNKSINITVPTATSDLTNDSNFATVSQIPTNNNQLTNGAGYISGIDSSMVTTALGYTPVSDTAMATALSEKQNTLVSGTNIKTVNNNSLLGSGNLSVGTVTSVNNTQPDVNGNVTIQTGGTIDDSFSTTSENPLQNRVITNALMDVTTGSFYVYGSPTISNNVISNMSTSDYILTDYVWNCTSSDTWSLTVWIESFDYVNNPIVFSNSTDGTKSIEVGFSQEKLYVKLSSDGSTWDIADTAVSGTNFFGGQMAFQLRYNSNYTDIFTYNGNYYSQYASYQGIPYNTNSQMKIYNSVSTNTTTIDLSKSNMVVNSTTVWDGSGGAIAYTPKFQEKLVSGTNIKTVNSTSLLGSGNINLVTTDTAQTISGRKTFTGEKAIYFKQDANTNKLGFTLYNPSNTELGAFEYRPNTISGGALLNVNTSYSSSDYVGFRYWGGSTTTTNIIAPKTNGNFYIPVNISDGTNTVTANNTGTVNISSLLPNTANFLQNTANGSNSLSILNTEIACSPATLTDTVVLGNNIGLNSNCSNAILLGSNSGGVCVSGTAISNTFSIISNSDVYQLLNMTTGLIPDDRINSTIARTSDLQTKADTDLSNLSATGQAVIDGDFVSSAKDLSSVKATGSYTIDLQSYLPSDNAKYEVWLTGSNYTSGSTYSRYKLYTDIMNAQLPVNSNGANYPWLTHTGTNSREGCFLIKVPVQRYIYEIIEGASFNDRYVPLTALGYRRLGTNS